MNLNTSSEAAGQQAEELSRGTNVTYSLAGAIGAQGVAEFYVSSMWSAFKLEPLAAQMSAGDSVVHPLARAGQDVLMNLIYRAANSADCASVNRDPDCSSSCKPALLAAKP